MREAASEHGGLSAKGRAAVQRFNEIGAVIDISQLSTEAALGGLNVSRTPFLEPFNARALTNVVKFERCGNSVAQGGGVIHVAPFAGYLFDSQDPTLMRVSAR